jgi:ribosomal protein S12 methylthiotransferase accessory factor
MAHADYTHPGHAAHGYFPASTNGLSSGNNVLEATCHAITEVVERDALSVWHHAPDYFQKQRRLNPDSVSNEVCQNCFEMISAADLKYGVWDITTDTGIPCYLCLIHEPRDSHNHLGLGSGCHPDRNVALRRAITEAAQTRLNYISGARDDLAYDEYSDDGRNSKRVYAEAMLLSTDCPRQFDDLADKRHETLLEDLNWMLMQLNSVGINEVCMVDLTQEKFGIPVVRVIIPGLEAPHDEASYVPGPRALAAESLRAV